MDADFVEEGNESPLVSLLWLVYGILLVCIGWFMCTGVVVCLVVGFITVVNHGLAYLRGVPLPDWWNLMWIIAGLIGAYETYITIKENI